MRNDERTEIHSWGDENFIQTRYVTGNVVRCELSIGRNAEKQLALVLAMAAEKGIIKPERVITALEAAKAYVKDKVSTTDHLDKYPDKGDALLEVG